MRCLVSRRCFSTTTRFGSKTYWETFYQEREGAFEWYLDAEEAATLIRNRLPRQAESILEVGCGTSCLGRKLMDEYDVILTDNVDMNMNDVITADVTNLPKDWAKRFDVVLDKGTFDAVSFRSLEDVQTSFREVLRVLKGEADVSCIISISGEDPEYRMDRIGTLLSEQNYGTSFEELSNQGYYLYRHIKRK